MRILHTESSDNWGGQEYRILEQMHWLNRNGHQAFLAARPNSEILRIALEQGLEAHAVDFHGQYNPRAILQARRLVKRLGIQVADCHGSRDAATLAFCRGIMGVIRSRHITQPLKGKWRNRLQWRLGFDRAIATADCIRENMIAAGLAPAGKADVVGEWAGDGFFDVANKQRHRAEVREEFNVPDGAALIGVVGMLRGDKAQENLILAVSELRERGRFVHGLLVGSGIGTQSGYEKELRDLVTAKGLEDAVTFAGYRDDVARITQALDALFITSIAVEAQSRAAPQAFAGLTPVVASRVGGVPELVRPGETGWLVAPGAPKEYADALEAILDGPERAKDIAARARAFAEKELRIDARMERTLEIYRSALR